MRRVIVVGGGPAGMMAAIAAAERGAAVSLWDANEKTGKKLYITGKGRCNLTNACSKEDFYKNIPRNVKFLMSSFTAFDNMKLMDFIENLGVPLKVERGDRVFPVSDKASDITKALNERMRELGVEVSLHTRCQGVEAEDGRVIGLRRDGGVVPCDAVVLATGGLSYPSTGSTGDGYRFAQALGHTIVPPVASLVPLETPPGWTRSLPGLSLKNVRLSAKQNGKKAFSDMGEMLFTHFGISGPLVLSLSAHLSEDIQSAQVSLDLKPAMTPEEINTRLLKEFDLAQRKQLAAALRTLMPAALVEPFALEVAKVDPTTPIHQITRAQRFAIGEALKNIPIPLSGRRPIEEAVITRGGVLVREVKARTMESRLVKGLHLAGEMLDVDGYTGGFNLQIAFTTGRAAGHWAADEE